MKSQFINLFFAGILVSAVIAQNDWVNLASVPQLNVYAANYSHNIFSGYLDNGNGEQLHYVFLESQGNPKYDPLVLWLNGGPGCSSLLGWLYEHGPFVFNEGQTTFMWNNFSWNLVANVLYMEAPACVGLNTCNNPNYTFNDSNVAQQNLYALNQWFQRYPNFTDNEFYVSGESYGGIYVPYLAYFIDQSNSNGDTDINLKGFAVGNGVTNYNYDTSASMPDYLFYHGIYPPSIRNQVLHVTCANPYSNDCQNFLFNGEYTSTLNLYNLYGWCFYQNETASDPRHPLKQHNNYLRFLDLAYGPGPLPGTTAPCLDGMGAYYWLNLPSVRTALHINPNITWNWAMCIEINYDINMELGSYWIYEQLVPKDKYNIMFYSGDVDASVSNVGSQRWIDQLVSQYQISTKVPYQAWTMPGTTTQNATQIVGWVVYYDGLEFVQVKGAGHMVPQWRRPEAFKMFSSYLNGTILS